AAIFRAPPHAGRRGREPRTRRLESRRRLRGDMIEEEKIETRKISDNAPPIPRSKLEEERHSLLIVDLLRLARTVSYRRYPSDFYLRGCASYYCWLWVIVLRVLARNSAARVSKRAPDDVADPSSDLVIGLIGRSKRDLDATELAVIHVEDNRGMTAQ